MAKMNPDILNVVIISSQELVYSGPARAVSAYNGQGHFDVMPQHAKFITVLTDKPITIYSTEEGENKEFSFPRAIMHVAENLVEIYADV